MTNHQGMHCMQTRRLKDRLKQREDGDTRRCPECGMVGVQMYSFYGEEVTGHPCTYTKNDKDVFKIEGKRYCRYCKITFHE